MDLAKKLAFAPIFLIFLALFFYLLNPLLKSTDLLFLTDLSNLTQILFLVLTLVLTSLFFAVFASLASDLKIVLAIGAIASSLSIILLPLPINFLIAVLIFASIFLSYYLLSQKLKSYLTFQPTLLISPTAKHFAATLIILSSLAYFLSVNQEIKQNGFKIPDSLLETALKFIPQPQESDLNLPTINSNQLDLLRENSNLLEQLGLGSGVLDSLPSKTDSTQDLIKQTINSQIQSLIKPYLDWIPLILALLFFITLQSIFFIFSFLISPLIWLTFYLLEKTGYIRFEIEMREAKKMMV
ncbi:hypothetical protein HYS91_00550 [Candidatus Daviesbacteria bacterium]|nr:hypothetical protein [Candidatus Daviesbacteria bacterium]